MKCIISKSAIAFIFTFTTIISTPAQTFLLQDIPGKTTQLGLRFMRPSLAQDVELSTLSGIYDFSVLIPVSANWYIRGSIPYSTTTIGEMDAFSGVGNIYVGAQYYKCSGNKTHMVTSFGLYLPTADEDAGIMGLFAHSEKIYKYIQNTLTLYANYSYVKDFPSGARFGGEIGPDVMIPTSDDRNETEIFLHYGLTAGYLAENISLIAEFAGLVLVSEDLDEFSDRFVNSINFGASYVSKNVKPGIFYKLYLKEDLSDMVDGVLGINIEVSLN